jgi:hypothetical protein
MKKLYTLTACLLGFTAIWAQLKAPVLNYPGTGSGIVDVNVRMDWNPSLGGTVASYEAQIDISPTFTNPVNLNTLGTSAKTNELDYNQLYYWRVRAKGSNGLYSPWSLVWSFTTFFNEFSGLTPNAAVVNPQITLKWDTLSGTTLYTFEYGPDSLFATSTTGTISHLPANFDAGKVKVNVSNLVFGQKYFWKVRAAHNQDQSGWSDVKRFTVISSVELLTPSDSIINVNPRRQLKCKNTPGVNEYRFMIDNSLTFDPNSNYYSLISVLDKDFKNDISVFVERLGFGQTFFWRVQGVNNNGASSWSEARAMFTLDEVTLSKPTDGAVGVQTKDAELSWKKVDGAESYQLYYDTDNTFSNPTKIIALGDTLNKVILNLTQWAVPYHWKVRAIHSKDTSNWSQVFSFSTKPTGLESPSQNYLMDIYPNPAKDVVFIDLKSKGGGNVKVELYNIVGKKVEQVNYMVSSSNQQLKFDVSGFEGGVYMMLLEFNGERTTRRLIIK